MVYKLPVFWKQKNHKKLSLHDLIVAKITNKYSIISKQTTITVNIANLQQKLNQFLSLQTLAFKLKVIVLDTPRRPPNWWHQ